MLTRSSDWSRRSSSWRSTARCAPPTGSLATSPWAPTRCYPRNTSTVRFFPRIHIPPYVYMNIHTICIYNSINSSTHAYIPMLQSHLWKAHIYVIHTYIHTYTQETESLIFHATYHVNNHPMYRAVDMWSSKRQKKPTPQSNWMGKSFYDIRKYDWRHSRDMVQ